MPASFNNNQRFSRPTVGGPLAALWSLISTLALLLGLACAWLVGSQALRSVTLTAGSSGSSIGGLTSVTSTSNSSAHGAGVGLPGGAGSSSGAAAGAGTSNTGTGVVWRTGRSQTNKQYAHPHKHNTPPHL